MKFERAKHEWIRIRYNDLKLLLRDALGLLVDEAGSCFFAHGWGSVDPPHKRKVRV